MLPVLGTKPVHLARFRAHQQSQLAAISNERSSLVEVHVYAIYGDDRCTNRCRHVPELSQIAVRVKMQGFVFFFVLASRNSSKVRDVSVVHVLLSTIRHEIENKFRDEFLGRR